MSSRKEATAKWEAIYSEPLERLPWYSPVADAELVAAIEGALPRGARLLDIGSGPGTTAADLAARGFRLLGVDISSAAVDAAAERFGQRPPLLRFQVADVLVDELPGGPYDGVVDRGTFGTLEPADRPSYVRRVGAVLRPGGHLFLKTFSIEEPGEWGPHRFSEELLRSTLGSVFDLQSVDRTTLPSTLDHDPRTLFSVWRRRA